MDFPKPKSDVAAMWADVEDRLAPLLRLNEFERTLYYYLLRKTLVQGKRKTARVTGAVIARLTGKPAGSVAWRKLHRFFVKGCVRVLENGVGNWLVLVLAPEEVLGRLDEGEALPGNAGERSVAGDKRVRRALLRREGGRCYYCFRVLTERTMTVDHVEPLCAGGMDALDNLVACCFECNLSKGGRAAAEFLRLLYRREAITEHEMRFRLEDLRALRLGRRIPRNLLWRKKQRPAVACADTGEWARHARLV